MGRLKFLKGRDGRAGDFIFFAYYLYSKGFADEKARKVCQRLEKK
jgi:hypothetical protein